MDLDRKRGVQQVIDARSKIHSDAEKDSITLIPRVQFSERSQADSRGRGLTLWTTLIHPMIRRTPPTTCIVQDSVERKSIVDADDGYKEPGGPMVGTNAITWYDS